MVSVWPSLKLADEGEIDVSNRLNLLQGQWNSIGMHTNKKITKTQSMMGYIHYHITDIFSVIYT